MIAANFRRYPEALAAQLCLQFTALRWALARPGSRRLRAIRAARAAAGKRMESAPLWFPPLCDAPARPTPAWVAQRKAAAKALAQQVRASVHQLFSEVRDWERRGCILKHTLVGFTY